jgi:cytochrome c oxidase accessory protein FixG
MCTACAAEAAALAEEIAKMQQVNHKLAVVAPGAVQSLDARAVNSRLDRDLYADRKKVYPKLASGKFRTLKWIVMIVALGVYYAVPWIRWPRPPDHPSQALLIDVANERLFIGPLEIWPQELYLVTGILVLSALALFLVTALAGRVWCGYACPQTVWTDLMVTVERFWQGDRNARMHLDAAPWTLRKALLKAATHASWLLIGLSTGGALVFYFRDAPTLLHEFLTGTAPAAAILFLGVFTGLTYLLGGIAREQVCTYMCPWPRIQGAMFDADSYLVSYRPYRGEPRGPHKKGDTWGGRGDCIDCTQCVAVCPMGIDIREGPQLECIQCALCIDACNSVMDKVGRPNLLIAYDTFHNLDAAAQGKPARSRIMRPRTVLYAVLIVLVTALMAVVLATRSSEAITVQADRDPIFVRLADDSIRNGYTVKILDRHPVAQIYHLAVQGLPGARLSIVGYDSESDPAIEVRSDAVRTLKVYVTVPADALKRLNAAANRFVMVIVNSADGSVTTHPTDFRSPPQ